MAGLLNLTTTSPYPGLSLVGDINSAFAALSTFVASSTPPSEASTGLSSIANLVWHDLTNNIIYIRDEANTTWMPWAYINDAGKLVGRANQAGSWSVVGGSGNAITLTLPGTTPVLVQGQEFCWKTAFANTGAVTLAVNGQSAIALQKPGPGGLTSLTGGELQVNQLVRAQYNGTVFQIMSPIATGSDVPVGSILEFGGPTPPTGYLFADGSAVNRTTYANLFAVYSTTYGAGDGSTTFNLPDRRGRVGVGRDDMGGTATNRITSGVSGITGTTLGATGGDQRLHAHAHSGVTGVENQSHTHSGSTDTHPGHAHSSNLQRVTGGGGATISGYLFGNFTNNGLNLGVGAEPTNTAGAHAHAIALSTQSANHNHSFTTNSAGAGNSQNVQPSIILNYIIRT